MSKKLASELIKIARHIVGAKPVEGVTNVKSYFDMDPYGTGEDASEFYDYNKRRPIEKNGEYTRFKLNPKKVGKFLGGKKVNSKEYGDWNFDEIMQDADRNDIDHEHNDSILYFEKDGKEYVAIWADNVSYNPNEVFLVKDDPDISELRLFRIQAVITFEFEGEDMRLYTWGDRDIDDEDMSGTDFYEKTGLKDEKEAWYGIAAMQK